MVVTQTTGAVHAPAEVKDIVHQVVTDGRFVDEFASNPVSVTNYLGIPVAKETKAKLTTYTGKADMSAALNHKVSAIPQVMNVVAIVIIVIVVAVLVDPPVVHSKGDVMPVNDPLEDLKD